MAAVEQTDIPYKVLDERVETLTGKIAISTMHFAKGLEFKSVAVMACDDEIVPLQERIDIVTDASDLYFARDKIVRLIFKKRGAIL